MRTLRLVAYGSPDLRTAYTVALMAAHSVCTCAQTFCAHTLLHPCAAAASFLPCARPPDRLVYQGQLPKEHLLLLDLRSPFGAHILSRPRGRPLHGGLSRSSSANPGHAKRDRRPVPAPFSGPVIGRCCRRFRAADPSTPSAAVCHAVGIIRHLRPGRHLRLPFG